MRKRLFQKKKHLLFNHIAELEGKLAAIQAICEGTQSDAQKLYDIQQTVTSTDTVHVEIFISPRSYRTLCLLAEKRNESYRETTVRMLTAYVREGYVIPPAEVDGELNIPMRLEIASEVWNEILHDCKEQDTPHTTSIRTAEVLNYMIRKELETI